MRQAVVTMMAAGLAIAVGAVARAADTEPDAARQIDRARRLIEAKDYGSATTFLEDLLPDAPAKDKQAILELLRQSYTALAKQAEATGRERDAIHYRDNLAIINRSRGLPAPPEPSLKRPKKTASGAQQAGEKTTAETKASAQPPTPAHQRPQKRREPREAPLLLAEPAPLPEPARVPPPDSLSKLTPLPAPAVAPAAAPARRGSAPAAPSARPGSAPAPSVTPPAEDRDVLGAGAQPAATPAVPRRSEAVSRAGTEVPAASGRTDAGPTLEEADRLFSGKRYHEAGRCYAALARENRLPAKRKSHWAYCRMVDVAIQMNARPRSAMEWDQIEAEILSIQRLAPNQWCAEYLRSKLAEVRREQRRLQSPSEEPHARNPGTPETSAPAGRLPHRVGQPGAATPAQPATRAPAQTEAAEIPAGSQRRPLVDSDVQRAAATTANDKVWHVAETPNFRIFHTDARLAEQAGEVAESTRTAQSRRWGSPAISSPWTPRCDIYLFPNGKAFARATGQSETAPGFSSMESTGGRITARRTILRTDQPHLLTAVLPHEVTHVVIADLFAREQIPFWADEGIAVLAEPEANQSLRTADLQNSLRSGKVVPLGELLTTDNPQTRNWSVYYAQCVSLTRFLVEQRSPAKFLQFVHDSHSKGIEAALRDSYRIEGYNELQERWMDYAREQLKALEQARRDESAGPRAAAER
jgi:hypothetical protein